MIENERDITIGRDAIHATHHRGDGSRYVVVAPPLFEEDARLRKVLVNLSRFLCDAGYDVVRFDYYGTGFSQGRYTDVTLERTRQNLDDALEYCRKEGAERIDLIGVRFGGYLALQSLENGAIGKVVAWEPVLNTSAYIKEVLRSEVATQMLIYGEVRQDREQLVKAMRSEGRIYVEGYLISSDLFDQLADGSLIKPDGTVFGENKVVFIYWQSRREHKKWSSGGVRSHWVDGVRFGYNHIRVMEPRSDSLYRQTMEELKYDGETSGTA